MLYKPVWLIWSRPKNIYLFGYFRGTALVLSKVRGHIVAILSILENFRGRFFGFIRVTTEI